MKKILFYCHVFYPQQSGYSHAFQNLIFSLLETYKDYHITVVTPHPLGNYPELKKERLKIIRLKPKIKIKKIRYFINSFFYAKEVSRIFKQNNYDILIIETFDEAIFLSFLEKEVYNKLAVRVHSTSETEYTFFENKFFFLIRRVLIKNVILKRIKWILSTNSYHIDFVKKYYFKGNQIKIGNVSFFLVSNTLFSENNLYGNINLTPSKNLKVFLLGRLDDLGFNQKGFQDFIYALRLIGDKAKIFDITIVGRGQNKEKLMKLSKGINNINFIDSLPHKEVINYLKKSDIVVLPSRYEGLSMFALEAIATGNLCIFSKTGGLVDLIDNNGYLFEPQNIEELAKILDRLSKMDKHEIEKMKKNSIELFNKKFAPHIIAEKFDKVYSIIKDIGECVV